MVTKVKDIMDYLHKKFPTKLAEDYDNVGLLIGDKDKDVRKILFTLDVTNSVIDEAISLGCDMIISHHPLIFTPIKKITTDDYLGRIIYKAIKNDLNIFAVHTNFDNGRDGLNDYISKKLNLEDIYILSPTKEIRLYKLVCYVPKNYAQAVREAILNEGAGHIGNYSHCSFNINGQGTFMPLEGSNPFIGHKNKLEFVDEVRIETIVKEEDLSKVVSAMLKVHPYEEVAYDIYSLKNSIIEGTGRIGQFKKAYTVKDLIEFIKTNFNITNVRVVGEVDRKIKKVAVVGGSGSSFIKDAIKNKCDVLITGDLKHHEALFAKEEGLIVLDIGHFGSEFIAVSYLMELVKHKFDVECVLTETNKNPFKTV